MKGFRILPLLIAMGFAQALPAQEWRRAPEYDVLLSTYDIAPKTIHLKAGEAVRLRFVNNSGRPLDFSASDFFANATLRKRDSNQVTGGRIRVGPGQSLTLALVPRPGRYASGSGHFVYRVLGMRGAIVVE